jgi:hypothetical protein
MREVLNVSRDREPSVHCRFPYRPHGWLKVRGSDSAYSNPKHGGVLRGFGING